jgi:hypothetical protein
MLRKLLVSWKIPVIFIGLIDYAPFLEYFIELLIPFSEVEDG